MRLLVTTTNTERSRIFLALLKQELEEYWESVLILIQDKQANPEEKTPKPVFFSKNIISKLISYSYEKALGKTGEGNILFSYLKNKNQYLIDRTRRNRIIHEHLTNLSGINPLNLADIKNLTVSPDPNNTETQKWVIENKPDLILVFGGAILKNVWLTTARLGIVNMHFGVLPYYRSSWSTEFAIYQERWDRIGATVHFLDEGVDTGNIISIHKVESSENNSLEKIVAHVYWEGFKGIISAAKDLISGKKIGNPTISAPNSYFPSRSFTRWHNAVVKLRLSQCNIPWPRMQPALENTTTDRLSRLMTKKRKYPPGVYIFLYHNIIKNSNNDEWTDAYDKVATPEKKFIAHIEYLLKHMTPLPLSKAFNKLWRDEPDKPYFVITFDDGYSTLPDTVPFLRQRNICPCVFINADFASQKAVYYRVLASLLLKRGKAHTLVKNLNRNSDNKFTEDNVFNELKNNYRYDSTVNKVKETWDELFGQELPANVHLTWEQLQELQKVGWEIGNHTLSHATLAGLSYEQLNHEIAENHEQLIDHGLTPLRWVSYPNGLARHVDINTEKWMLNHPDFYGIHAGGGVNFFPSQTEWLRIPLGNDSLGYFKQKIQKEINRTFHLFNNIR